MKTQWSARFIYNGYEHHKNNTIQKKLEYNYHLLTKDIDSLFKQAIVKRNEQESGVQEISYSF